MRFLRVFILIKSDLDWIQTSNLLSRNQVRYSVAPRGHYWAANIKYYYALAMLEIEKLSL